MILRFFNRRHWLPMLVLTLIVGGGQSVAASPPDPARSPDRPESESDSIYSDHRPRIGLVLSGGGALGFAHIGTLQMLDSLGIKIDCITGTSIGAIIGGLYAAGYSGAEIEDLALAADWLRLFPDRPPRGAIPFWRRDVTDRNLLRLDLQNFRPRPASGLFYGQNVTLYLAGLLHHRYPCRDFDRLPIPLRCVAFDIVSGDEVILGRGSLPRAMRASMSLPMLFSPVPWGERLLVDGGIVNNLPVDVAREMGADIVIAVDLGKRRSREKIRTALDVVVQWVSMVDWQRRRLNRADADILIEPRTEEHTILDFESGQVRELMAVGKSAARNALPELMALRDSLALTITDDADDAGGNPKTAIGKADPPRLAGFAVSGNHYLRASFIRRRLGLRPGDLLGHDLLRRRIDDLYGQGYFERIEYELLPVAEGRADLLITVTEKPKDAVLLGLRFDNYHQLVATAGLQISNHLAHGLHIDNEIQLVGLTRAETRLYYPAESRAVPLNPFLMGRFSDISHDLYDNRGRKVARYDDRSTTLGAGLEVTPANWLNLQAAWQMEFMDTAMDLGSEEELPGLVSGATLSRLRASLTLDTLDDAILPCSGLLLRAVYRECLESLGSDLLYGAVEFSLDHYLDLGAGHNLQTHLYRGHTWRAPIYKYLDRGRPDLFVGLNYHQLFGSSLTTCRLDYRYRYSDFVSFKLTGNLAPEFALSLGDEPGGVGSVWGVGLGIKIVSPLGTMQVIGSRGVLRVPGHSGYDETRYHLSFLLGTGF